MSYNIESAPFYYGEMTAKERSFVDFMQNKAMVKDIDNSISRNTDRSIAANALLTESINSRILDAQIASTNAIYNNTQEMIGAFYSGFSDVSRQIGNMSASMSMAFAALNTTVQASAQAIYDRLDTMNDILNNPFLTKSRELFRRAAINYNKGFYEEAKNDLLDALATNKTDYISWFLLGKTYLFGAGEFSVVIDLDAAIEALKNATKFITPDARKEIEVRIMAAEMSFYLGLAQQTKAMDMLHMQNEADCRIYLEQAVGSYSQSWDYSAKMLEAMYNRSRCKVLLRDVDGAIPDLETVILQDRNYCVKVCADNDFSIIEEQFANLIKKLKNNVFIPAKNDYDHINTMLSEFASYNGKTEITIPSIFTEELPYFDVLDYSKNFKQIMPIIENLIKEHEEKYNKLFQAKNHASTEEDFLSLSKQFQAMNGYKNTSELAVDCNNQYHLLQKYRKEKEHKDRECRIEQERIERERRQEQERIERERYEEEKRKKDEEYRKWNNWLHQGLCIKCGSKMRQIFRKTIKKCKSCGWEVSYIRNRDWYDNYYDK